MAGFSFRYSRKNPRKVPAGFRLLIAPAQFAFRFHFRQERVRLIGIPHDAVPINIACPNAFWFFVC
jgi:hypothetical protein